MMFVLQNATRPFSGIPGLRIEPLEVAARRSPFDLSLFLRERGGKYIGHFEYSTDLFNRDRIERMAGHYRTLLEGIVADPDQSIATLPILTEAERHQILVEWNDTAADFPKDKGIHQLFEEQVERIPEAIAVEFEDRQITYQELNRRANQLAHHLISLGIGPEKLVGICVERSIEMVVGLLGILKAGGAYVPLDPAYPEERLQFMVQDAQVSVLLTQSKLLDQHEKRDPPSSILHPRLTAVCLDRDWRLIAQQKEDNPKELVTSENLAYVIYTSGSTGTPKGVAIEHRNTVNLLYWAKSTYGPPELAGVLASTSICFDLSIFELFVPLSWGGKIILVENALSLRERADRGLTLINIVPSVLAQVLALGRLPESVRVVNLAGEPLKTELVNRLYEEPGVQKVYDLYGPSETTTYSTFTLRRPNGPETIGRPIANTQVYILDGALQPVAAGVEGELYIGGAGVGRGYLNRSQLTAEKFMVDLFRGGEGRLYRTGDRGRYLPDGSIEFLGRTDNQVKIRGHRIELGEIESALMRHPAVKESVIVSFDEFTRDSENRKSKIQNPKSLVAYVVPREQSVLSANELRSYLEENLPEYMIPSSFTVLEALPLMPNGKVDRNNLPPLDGIRTLLTQDFILPRTEIEELIAQTWREVLKIENIGIFDNFFEMGGHSLLATQIAARLQEAFNKEVPLRVLFDAPTIAELAQELERIICDGHAPELPPIVRVARDKPLPLSLNQEHLWRIDQMMPGTQFFNVPFVYQLSGALNFKALESAAKEIVRRHEALRTVFGEVEGKPIQIVKDGSDFQLQITELRGRSPDDASQAAAEHILEERSAPFDLATGPLVRMRLLRLTEKDSLFLVTVHHIISDYWSMRVFSRELVRLYKVFADGSRSPLREPQIQFGDYAHWERRLLEDNQFHDQRIYWKDQINAIRGQCEIDTATKRGSEFLFEYTGHSIDIGLSLLTQIKHLAIQQSCTPFIVVVSAAFVLLYFTLGEPHVRIGTLVANRRKRETENVIGHFVNTLVLHTYVSLDDTFTQVVNRVRAASFAAYARQEFPFEQIAREFEAEHDIRRGSLIRVLFNYQKHTLPQVTAAGLTFASCNLPVGHSNAASLPSAYDLIFDVKELPTALTGTVNVRSSITKPSGAGNAWTGLQKILEVSVSQPTRSFRAVNRL
jgi:amino acid adenylation domain-containing protein